MLGYSIFLIYLFFPKLGCHLFTECETGVKHFCIRDTAYLFKEALEHIFTVSLWVA